MTIYLPELAMDEYSFPPPYQALDEPNGLLAFGGDLHPKRIISAYQSGIFPWYSPGEPILWWSPSPRAILNPKTFNPAKSLRKFQRKAGYAISMNQCTDKVIELCSSTRTPSETWLNPEMKRAYQQLSRLGYCHSIEVWQDAEIIGGLYGIQMGKIFCGESMFSLKTNASKIGLWAFCQHFYQHGGQLIDCQLMNPHLASLGAEELERDLFIQTLSKLKYEEVDPNCYSPQWILLNLSAD
ncbi:leucyl/phenylalanyl-tRNA--protein transferase [Vibrio mangrovi]|uniref:Leucyl/phenylalanyl-tRNA--protein transferase n=1 Tax=Vibrio mangrovi TaxID=474394 RepID=A0A1Y6IQ46_9VIBR|nr:leucyl/phenylalanyl-tRNA--protein transferase [Vibrio mangrovi]MDW6004281.1 leucyl/phenylalanyl-tRNA--protein transferase [Vibrio mangrovi]SMR98920.1 Leucyl/phenylalanyl-tRNA--protein transferase [Vibrio mangrovi]